MKRRLLGLLTAAAMLLSAMPVFAGGEIPSGDDLIWYNDGTNISEFSGGVSGASVDSGAIKMTLTYEGTADTNLQIAKNVAASSDENYTGILSFKIKAGQTDKHFWIQIGDGVSKTDFPTLALTAAGKIAYSAEGAWLSDKNAFTSKVSTSYTQGEWYDIDMVFNKKTATIDYYVNGVQIGSSSVPSNKLDMTTSSIDFKPSINVAASASALSTPGTANFWLDDITWTTGSDNSFYAFADSDEYTAENPTIGLKFTEQVSNTALASDIKVYNVQSGAAVAATAAFDGNRDLKININEKLTAAEEYRIAMPALTSVTGKAIYNDNVYFMSGESVETIFSDDFSGYDTSEPRGNQSGGGFYKPKDWETNANWADNFTTLKPTETEQSDGTSGNVVEFKKGDDTSAENGKWSWAAIYRAFGKKVNTGVLTVEYDVKAVKALNKDEAKSIQTQLLFGVYKDELTSEEVAYPATDTDKAKNKVGVEGTVDANNVNNNVQFVGGIQGGAICRFIDNISRTDGYYHLDGNKDAVWNVDDSQSWYKVRVTFDYNKKTVSTNVVGVKDLGSYPMSNFGIENGISALSFGSSRADGAVKKDIYLDNVTVKHDTSTTKVSKVRFIDGNGAESGISDSVSTLSEKVQITFVNGAIDSDCATTGVTLTDSENNSIGLINGEFNSDRTVYTAELADLMKANTNYTLSVSGLTSGGLDIPVKTYSLKTEENGYFDVSKPYINGTIAAGNTITIGVKVLNTTGENKNVTFSYATYSGNQMIGCELEEKGVGGENKAVYTKEYTLTLDAETAAKLTDIRAFVWGDLTSVVPLTDFASLTK